jgi:hypothetical protein
MITNTGKSIVSKYLVGQAPAYASHIAIGCGAAPKNLNDNLNPQDYLEKADLDFEMIRAPIISRGYVVDEGDLKIVFTAELPTQERYEITEVGLYPAGSNQLAVGFDSRVLYFFSRQEPWKLGELPVTIIDKPLDELNSDNDIDQFEDEDDTVPRQLAFQTNATNKVFSNEVRQEANEQSRFLNNMMLLRGDFSEVDGSGNITTGATSRFISLSPISINLDKNAPTDKLKVAFSIVNVEGAVKSTDPQIPTVRPQPEKVRILVEFTTASGQSAKFITGLESSSSGVDFPNNRYYVLSTMIKDLEKTSGFSWSQVNSVKVYGAILNSTNQPSDNFYIALDAIRLDNINSYNPLYGLTGYTVIKNVSARPIVKLPNTTSLIEFRLGVGIS